MWKKHLCLLTAFCAIAESAGAGPPGIIVPDVSDPVLVRAHAATVERNDIAKITKFVIDEILIAPKSGEKPERFTGYSLEVDISGDGIMPIPSVGERGIWLIQKNGDVWISQSRNPELVEFPTRQGITPNHEQLEKLADTVSAVHKLPKELQLQRLETIAVSADPLEAAWAVRRLEIVDRDRAIGLCRLEENLKLMTVRAALAADLVLARNDVEDSHVLKRLLEGIRAGLPEDEQLLMGTMLTMRCQIGKTDQAGFEELIIAYILNEKHSRNSRHAALFGCQFLAKRGATRSAQTILSQIKSESIEQWVKEEAAGFEKQIERLK